MLSETKADICSASLLSFLDDEQVNQPQAGEDRATTVVPVDNLEMESPTKAPTTDSSSTCEPPQSCIIPDCYVDASIPPESHGLFTRWFLG